MELNEMEKRLIFQTEGYGKSDVTYVRFAENDHSGLPVCRL